MDVDIAVLFLELEAVGIGIIKAIAVEHDLGAEGTRAFDLEDWRRRRHADDSLDAEFLCGVGNTLGMVAGRSRDNAFGAFFRRQLADFIVGTAKLEGTGMLKIFWFEIDVVVAELGKIITVDESCLACHALELLRSAVNVSNCCALDNFFIRTLRSSGFLR